MTWYRIKPNRFPAMFVQPVDREDLSVLMKYANDHKQRLVPRSSGHNISNPVLAQDAITVDMSRFDEIEEPDLNQKFVWAGPGVLSETLNKLLFAKGFAFPSAHTGFVTIGGYLLGALEILIVGFGPTELSPYRDAIVFALLIVFLLFRPGGIMQANREVKL